MKPLGMDSQRAVPTRSCVILLLSILCIRILDELEPGQERTSHAMVPAKV